MVQRILDQRYELEELIGGGGMADVYKAKDCLLNRPVAVKILHEEFKQDKEFIDKFQREAQAAARLSHPNIVNIYDVGVADGDHYIVMEYVPGRTLKDRIRQEGHLSVSESLRVAREIADPALEDLLERLRGMSEDRHLPAFEAALENGGVGTEGGMGHGGGNG